MAFGEVEEGSFTGLLRFTEPPGESVTVRVFKRFGEYRVETPDGELVSMRRHLSTYDPETGLDQPTWSAYLGEPPSVDNAHAIERRELSDWQGDNFSFTRPTGPARAVTFLGRPCWEVELAPSEDDPSPLTLTIDAATGIQFKAESRDSGPIREWLEIDFGVELDDELFGWEGTKLAAYSGTYEDHPGTARTKTEKKWLKKSGVGGLTLLSESKINVHDLDPETGEFEGSFDADQYFSLGRRPSTGEPWDEDDGEHEALWEEGGWQWRLQSSHRIRKRTLKHLRRQTRRLSVNGPD